MLSRGLAPRGPPAAEGGATSLPRGDGDGRDFRRERALAMHAQVTAAIASPPAWDGHTTRAEEIRRYQGMIEGDRGMKHVHADYRPDGGTQIGGISTQTTSMTANWESETLFKDITQTLAKGAPPIRAAMPSHLAFRTA